jgi:hypothetical protein
MYQRDKYTLPDLLGAGPACLFASKHCIIISSSSTAAAAAAQNLTRVCSLHIAAFCFLQQKRVASLRTRTVSTVAMIAGFLGVIYAGHVPLVFLVLGLQVWPAAVQPAA